LETHFDVSCIGGDLTASTGHAPGDINFACIGFDENILRITAVKFHIACGAFFVVDIR